MMTKYCNAVCYSKGKVHVDEIDLFCNGPFFLIMDKFRAKFVDTSMKNLFHFFVYQCLKCLS